MEKKDTRGGARKGSGAKIIGDAVMVVKSHRMTPKQWKAFDRWGGVDRLRKTVDDFMRAEVGAESKAAGT